MERMFVEVKYEGKLELPKELLKELPEKVVVAATVQFVEQLPAVKSKLAAYGKQASFFRSVHGKYQGQILGCDSFKVQGETEAFLYIGDGEFHPRALLVNEKPVFWFNPLSQEWGKFGRKESEEAKLRKRVALMKLQAADKVGIIVSTKEGQKMMQGQAEELKKRLESRGKEVYLFLGDEVRDLENFNFIETWVNTACPRIADDIKGMVNLRDLA